MAFKAKLATTRIYKDKNKGKIFRQYTTPVVYTFSKRRITFPHGHPPGFQSMLSGSGGIASGDAYTLKCLTKDDFWSWSKNSRFQAVFENGITVNLITTWKDRWKLRFTHGLTLWQKHQEGIIKTAVKSAITTGVAAIVAGIVGYFSYQAGYSGGVKKGKEESLKIPQQAAGADTTKKNDGKISKAN